MRERFEGNGGRNLLLDVLLRQDIVQRDVSLATTLADEGVLCEYQPGDHIVTQGASDNDVYFLIAGESNVLVNNRFVGSRLEGTCIGEMSALDASAARSATVEAKTTVVALKPGDLAPRDNLVFALGVFLSQLARERVFLIKPQEVDVKIPWDLLGVTQIAYTLKPGRTIEAAIAPVCLELRNAIASLGLR